MNTMYVCIINIDKKCKMFVPIDPEIANVMRSGAKSWTVMKIADDICKELRKFFSCSCFVKEESIYLQGDHRGKVEDFIKSRA